MAIFTVTSGSASDLAVVAVSPVISNCTTYYQWNITANAGDSISFSITGNHYESRYIRNGTQTSFTDGAATTYDNTLSVGFLLLNSGTTGIFSSATIRITNTTTNRYYETTVTREDDSANCYEASGTVTKTSDLLNDGETGVSSFIEFSDMDLVPTDASTNPVQSNGVYDAIEAVKDADLIAFDSYLTITSNNVQAAIEELKDEVDGFALPGGIMLQSVYDTNGNNIVDNAEDSQLLDGLDSTQFLRSDASDSKTFGNLAFNNDVAITFGTSADYLDIRYVNSSTETQMSIGADLLLRSTTQGDLITITNDASSPIAITRDVTVPDEAYGAGWNGSLEVPTKNAVYDQIQVIAAGGEVNTASNLTGDEGVFAQKSAQDLEFKSLTAGSGITLSSDSNQITISATGGGGAVDSVFGRTGVVTATAGDYDGLYASLSTTASNGDNYLHIGRNNTVDSAPALYVNQLGTGDIARFFKGTALTDGSSGTQVTITNTGGVTATGTFTGDGSGLTNVNATTLDSLDSTSFLRSDTADTKTSGDLTFSGGVKAVFGVDGELYSNSTSVYLDLQAASSGNFFIRDQTTTRFTFERTTGNFTAEGAIVTDGNQVQIKGNSPRVMWQENDESSKQWFMLADGTNLDVREGDVATTRMRFGAANQNILFYGNDTDSASAYSGGIFMENIGLNTTSGSWIVRGETNDLNYTGLYFSAGGDGQLILRDNAGNIDISLLADGISSFNNSIDINNGASLTFNSGGDIFLASDSSVLNLGAGNDIQMYYNGSNAFIDFNTSTGDLYIREGTTERFRFMMDEGTLKFGLGNIPDADNLNTTELNTISTSANFSGSTNYPTSFGQTLVVRGNDGSDGNRNIYLHKVNGDTHEYYLGYHDSSTGAEWTQIWTDDYNGGGGADNLGNHTATQDLNMGAFDIDFDDGSNGLGTISTGGTGDMIIDSRNAGSTDGSISLRAAPGIGQQRIIIDAGAASITAPDLSISDINTAGAQSIATKDYVDSASSSLPYDYYFAGGINQSGTSAPTASFTQTVGIGSMVWSRTSAGVYRLTRSSGTFTTARTQVIAQLDQGPSSKAGVYVSVNSTYIEITTASILSGTNADNILDGSIHIIEFP